MPLEDGDQGLLSGGGQFFKIRQLKPGECMKVKLVSMLKNTNVSQPKFCIKDKGYNYRVAFVDEQGMSRIMDISSPAAIGEISRVLIQDGKDVPCEATFTRRTERKTSQSELEVVRTGEVSDADDSVPI